MFIYLGTLKLIDIAENAEKFMKVLLYSKSNKKCGILILEVKLINKNKETSNSKSRIIESLPIRHIKSSLSLPRISVKKERLTRVPT